MEFSRRFPDDEACLEYLWRSRYSPDGEHAHCPKCNVERTFRKYHMSNRNTSWTCTGCGHHVHPTAGTIFHKSSTSLHLWFYAMYIMASTRCGVSAKQLERELGVTYKTAWRMFNLIRNQLMDQDESDLHGAVEADETYIGGRRKGKTGRPGTGDKQKTPVFGMVERGGKVRATHLPNAGGATLKREIGEHVLPASMIFTDEWPTYRGLDRTYIGHRRIRHKDRIYVDGDVHTQTIEGFFGLVKNGIRGVYHAVSRKRLHTNVDEYSFRYNRRDGGQPIFWAILDRVEKGRLAVR